MTNNALFILKFRYMLLYLLVGFFLMECLIRLPLFHGASMALKQEIGLLSVLYVIPVLLFYKYCRKHSINFQRTFFAKPSVISTRMVVMPVIMLLVFQLGCLMALGVLILSVSSGELATSSVAKTKETADVLQVWIRCIVVAFLAPIAEEILFRGYLLRKLHLKFSMKTSVIISSITFGILHLQATFSAVLFGVVMCLLYIKSRSLVLPIIVHMIQNILIVTKDVISISNPSESTGATTAPMSITIGIIAAVLFLGVGLFWIIPFFKRNWRDCMEKGLPKIIYHP
ncbi:CPBP family intramembrane glutamic endopeptidase [Bacillus cereus group sp. BfR-BA-01309]|uniref:CPBP family intramembrane glutamic endopeptidase n=1 Tax=Bacillus cereus group sp. BfR-BA-01309 TaxID=2920286 RepID=UPI001F560328|nr:type II CAAX endopeptidase family protein [Bacillus cereus group sp. BfR-BA-01309]